MTQLKNNVSQVQRSRLCQGCELPVDVIPLNNGKRAHCPRCGTQLYRGGNPTLSGNTAIALTCLLLFIPSYFYNFISIRLFGVMISASLPSGILDLFQDGFILLPLLIFFCSTLAPLIVCSSVLLAHWSIQQRWFKTLQTSLWLIQNLKHWVMLDVFLVSIAISCFKLQELSDIYVGPGLIGLILLQVFTVMLLSRICVRRYWEAWQPEVSYKFEHIDIDCHECHLSQPKQNHCQRCHHQLYHLKLDSIQRTWAYLVAATIVIFPANFIPISILTTNGQRIEDTIYSGVMELVQNGMYGIAVIIFIASIVVPVVKLIGLSYILLCIQFKQIKHRKQQMMVYFVVKWIGKWSVMDLFVISIMMTLIDRGQILDFTPGYGAVAFGAVIVFTMLAADSLDPRYIWKTQKHTSIKEQINE
ncbi:paraquat-inducible protein A [Vibrio sagamiensis]|uniref:Paraquat-inducible protein A n=1 Tax=Vibrio sagamiensis NBRC 104589 TaxID=1219064 RepID=A0A511QI37_9VIBR|nr:paraquat-inducible protein A [Vibrio sagamiensis]PNQ62039.1 paraquat-inducible protein A [Vibrio agarivorans]GEM76951.1 paraquat-inducible protein A [Vibrio sagamiensis NBRC 104589]